MWELIAKLNSFKAFMIVLAAWTFVISPFCFIFQFANEFVEKYELIKTLLICLSVSLPVVSVNLLWYGLFESDKEPTKNWNSGDTIGLASIMTLIVFYIPCIASFFVKLSLRQAIYISIGVEALFYIAASLEVIWTNTRKSTALDQKAK